MAAVYSSFDLATLPSAYGEGCPNAVAEAMACGVPCVVTDVGDAAAIVGSLGAVVPRGDAARLCVAWQTTLDAEHPGRAAVRRRRIEEHFALERMVDQAEKVLTSA
jgi:glycosyltransferase involved in cell wall biosynthesis